MWRGELLREGGKTTTGQTKEIVSLAEQADQAVREGGDEGKPIVVMDPMHPVSQAFIAIAKQLAAQASIHALSQTN